MKPTTSRRLGCIIPTLGCILFWVVIICALCGCTSTRYVPVETVRTEYRDREINTYITDTVHDTRLVMVKGDTILDIREKERVHRVEIHDTLYILSTDTIRSPYPVEKPLTRWQQAKMDLGGIAIGALIITICAAVVWLIKKFRK